MIPNISAPVNNITDFYDISDCFVNSAIELLYTAIDQISDNEKGRIGFGTNNHFYQYFITALFLARHALELTIKALITEIKEIEDKKLNNHNIKKLWEEHIPDYQNVLPEEIQKAFGVLEKFGILENEELFRYHKNKKGLTLMSMKSTPIAREDIEAVNEASQLVKEEIHRRIHVKKGLPL